MARASNSSTKFASVNLNKSYGKPAAPQGSQLPGSGGSRSRSHGGMLLLTRPVRSQQQPAAAAAMLQKGAKLTVPLPVNLPSLRREHSGNDPTIALVGGTGASGWPKQQQQQREAEEVPPSAAPVQAAAPGEVNAAASRSTTPALTAGSTWGTSQPPSAGQPAVNPQAAQFAALNGDLRPSSSPQMVARSGVYTPPRARTVPAMPNAVPPPRPAAVEKAVVLRGEEFPSLQAALPPPRPPQRQKELQQKQREKQQELKDQHQKLQLLSHKPPGEEPLQPQVASQVQPSHTVSLPAKREEPPPRNESSSLSLEPQAVGHGGSRPGFGVDAFSPHGPPAPVRVNPRSNWTDDERGPAQSLRPQGGQTHFSEWPDRPDREHFFEDSRRGSSRAEDYRFGRQLSQREIASSLPPGGRDAGFGRDVNGGRDGGFGSEGHAREGSLNSSHNVGNIQNRDERFGREAISGRDAFPGSDGGYPAERGHGKDGIFNRELGMGRDGGFGRDGGHGRVGASGRENVGAGREFLPGRESNLDRENFGRLGGGGGGGRDFANERESFSYRDGFGKEVGPRESFYREPSFGRDNNFNREGPHGRDVRRPPSGGYEGGRGRFGGERFGRSATGRFNSAPDFNENKGGPFVSGRGGMGLDSGVDFNREKRFGAPYSEDAFARDFPDLPGLDFRASAGPGEALSVESKLLRRKKEEAKVSAMYDSEREAFEAELERVQKLQEQERLRKLEEKERAIEQARKEQEEQERLAREKIELELKLEEEAREAAARAAQEELEAAQRIEDEKRAREEEKRAIAVEEERRKENARRKLMELEERIAKRDAERKQKDFGMSFMPEEDRLQKQRQMHEVEVADREEAERIVLSLEGVDQDDDDRAPLRPARRPASPVVPRSHEEFPSKLKSPDIPSTAPAGRRMPDLRGGNAFEADRSRSFMPWRRDIMENGSGPSHASLYGHEEGPEFQFNMPRERMYPARREYGERESFYGGPNSMVTTDSGPVEYPARKGHGYQDRRRQADESGHPSKRAASPRAITPNSEGGYPENPFDRSVDRHWAREKIGRHRPRGSKPISPPPQPSYLQGPDTPDSAPSGRLRHSFAKQPRVPPPPLRAAQHRPPVKSARELGNSSSPLLHPGSNEIRSPLHKADILENDTTHRMPSEFRGHRSHSSMVASKQSDSLQIPSFVRETSPAREPQRPAASLRPHRTYLESAKGSSSELQDDKAERPEAGVEKDLSSRDDSSLTSATPESHVGADEESAEEVLSRGSQAVEEISQEREDAKFTANDDVDENEEEYDNEVHVADGKVGENAGDELDRDEEAGFSSEGDLDQAPGEKEELAGEWEDEIQADVQRTERIEDPVDRKYESGAVEEKEHVESATDYKEYEHSLGEEYDNVSDLKNECEHEDEGKETSTPDPPEMNQQEKDMSQQPGTQPFLQHVSLAPSVSLASVVPVQTAQGDNYIAKVQQSLSFAALSMPQPPAPSVTSQVPSLVASLPVLQNSAEGPVTVQFGLLPSTSLLPVPAIQIGSLQMPLHLNSQTQSGPQPSMLQFGQLSHQNSVPALVHPLPFSQSLGQPQTADAGSSQPNGQSVQRASTTFLQEKESHAPQGARIPTQSLESSRASQAGHNTGANSNSIDSEVRDRRSGGKAGFRSERRGRERSSRDAAMASQPKSLQIAGVLDSSSSENSVLAPVDTSFENQNGDGSWNHPHSSGQGRGGNARWVGQPPRGRGKSGSRGVLQGGVDEPSMLSANHGADAGPEAARPRANRRTTYRRTEFKVRESTLPSDRTFPESGSSAKHASGREKHSSQFGWTDSSDINDGFAGRDGRHDSASYHQERKLHGDQSSHAPGGGRSAQGSAKNRSSGNDPSLRSGRHGSGHGGTSRPAEGVLGKYSPELTSDGALLDAQSEEDDFIEVRSKRQMLNDRREQKEKELKAKTKDIKAKEQAARKQRGTIKAAAQGELQTGSGSKTSGLTGSEMRATNQNATVEASSGNSSRLGHAAVVSTSSLLTSSIQTQPLPPIGTPAGGSADSVYEKRSRSTKPSLSSAAGGNIVEADVSGSSAYDNQDGISGSTHAWGGTRSTLQVVRLTQIQLEEAMKLERSFEGPVPQQLPFSERSTLVRDPVATVSSAPGHDKSSAPSGPIGSLLVGEKIQFGAVTSPPTPLSSSPPFASGLNVVVGSSIGPRADGTSEENDLKHKSKRLSVTGNEVGSFAGKTKRTRGDGERVREGVDTEAEAEAEAAASAVAVAAISSDESVGSTHHSDGQNLSLRGVGLSGAENKTVGKSVATSLQREPRLTQYERLEKSSDQGMPMGEGNSNPVMVQGSGLDELMSVALPADLSVEPASISLQGPASNSGGLILSSLPGGQLPYRGLEMGTMLGGPIFGFDPSKDAPQGPQGPTSGSMHDQGIPSSGSSSAGWQAQQSGGVDSYYAGPPPSSYAGPFINSPGGIPSIQGPPHMLVYTNPFASVGQFGQLGVGFMNPQQYLPSGKQPDWKHTPVSTSGVGMSGGEVGGGLGGIMSGQRSSGPSTNVQRMAPGPSVVSSPGPFDLNLTAPFQIPGVEVSMQSKWSNVPGAPLHTVPMSGPLMGFALQSRHPRGPTHIGHIPHMMENTSGGFNLVPASNPASSGLFQSTDPAAQFPDEPFLGDSSAPATNNSSSFRGQRPSNRTTPASNNMVTPTGAAGVGLNSTKLRSGRRPSRVTRGGGSLGGGGSAGGSMSSVGMGQISGASGQAANGSRAPSPHLHSPSQVPPVSIGQHSHPSQYSDQRGAPQQQGLPRMGVSSAGWSGQGRKGGGPGRPPVADRASAGDKTFVSSSKLKQVYVVKPSSSPRRNMGDPSATNLFSGSEMGQTAIGH